MFSVIEKDSSKDVREGRLGKSDCLRNAGSLTQIEHRMNLSPGPEAERSPSALLVRAGRGDEHCDHGPLLLYNNIKSIRSVCQGGLGVSRWSRYKTRPTKKAQARQLATKVLSYDSDKTKSARPESQPNKWYSVRNKDGYTTSHATKNFFLVASGITLRPAWVFFSKGSNTHKKCFCTTQSG